MLSRIVLPILFLIFIASAIYYGCRGDNKVLDSDESFTRERTSEVQDYSGCYTLILGQDTATMKLERHGNGYAGDLVYKKQQKNTVSITNGRVFLYSEGPYLKGYHLTGKNGINYKETIFKKEGKWLVEGYGDAQLNHDTLAFKFPNNLEFDLSNPFKNIPCP